MLQAKPRSALEGQDPPAADFYRCKRVGAVFAWRFARTKVDRVAVKQLIPAGVIEGEQTSSFGSLRSMLLASGQR